MEGTNIVTVDLGTHKLGLSVCRIDRLGNPEVISYDEYPSRGISHGKVLNATRLGESIRESIGKTEQFLGLKVSQAIVNLQKFDIHESDFTCRIDTASGNRITSEDVSNLSKKALEEARGLSEGEEVFGMVIQCYETDDELGVPEEDVVGMVSSSLSGKFKAYLGKSAMRVNIEEAFRQAGIESVKAMFVPDKVGAAVLTETQMQGGVALLDIGAGATSVSVFYGGALRHYGAVPFGGDSITSDIRNLCGIEENLAENIKMGYGGCLPDRLGSLGDMTLKIGDARSGGRIEITTKYLSEIITARMSEILDAMFYEIQVSGYADKMKNGIVVVGGGANLMNVCMLIRQMSGYSAKIGAPLKTAVKAESVFFHPGAASSAGLVLDYSPDKCKPCTEKIINIPPETGTEKSGGGLFGNEEIETQPSVKQPKAPKVKTPKKPGLKFGELFSDMLFGSETDKDNEL